MQDAEQQVGYRVAKPVVTVWRSLVNSGRSPMKKPDVVQACRISLTRSSSLARRSTTRT